MNNDSPDKHNDLADAMVKIFAGAVILTTIVISAYINTHGIDISNDHERWAQFGDIIGGILNPIFGFFGLIFLLITIVIQNKELGLSRDELSKSNNTLIDQQHTMNIQRFENSFFQMLHLQSDITNSIKIQTGQTSGPDHHEGKECFLYFHEKMHHQLTRTKIEGESRTAQLEVAFETTYLTSQAYFSHYFEYIYQIFVFLNTSNIENKERYFDIAKAQLSSHERIVLYYYCLTETGKKLLRLNSENDICRLPPKNLYYKSDDSKLITIALKKANREPDMNI